MSLAKLLSTGKSLVGGSRDDSNRYRMGSPGLLPKFGSGNKAAQEESGIQAPGSGSAEGEPAKCLVQKATPTSALSHRMGEGDSKPSGEPRLKEEPAAVRAYHQSWLRRIIARVTCMRMKQKPKDVPRFAKSPVQAELLLDRVRVVRNDLSDSDLEIVPARKDSGCSEMSGTRGKTAEKDCLAPEARLVTAACEELRK